MDLINYAPYHENAGGSEDIAPPFFNFGMTMTSIIQRNQLSQGCYTITYLDKNPS